MKTKLAAISLMVLLSGCVATGVQVSNEQAAAFQKGVSTQAEVIGKLGNPTSTTVLPNGERQLMYIYTQAQARPSSFIPIVGALVGGADSKSTIAIFRFGSDSKLMDYTFNKSEYGTATGFAAGTMPQVDQPKQ